MNEQIKKLAEQAGIEEWWDSGNERREVLQEHLEKFAELIVRECVDKAERYGLGSDAVEQMKEDFGVEE